MRIAAELTRPRDYHNIRQQLRAQLFGSGVTDESHKTSDHSRNTG
jgi:hypothetical protein